MSLPAPASSGAAPGRAWPVLGAIGAVAVLLVLLVVVSSSMRDRADERPASTLADPEPMRSLVLPEEFEGWTRVTDTEAQAREAHPYGEFQPPDDPEKFFSSVIFREYEREGAVLEVLQLTTTGQHRETSASVPAHAANDFMHSDFEDVTTMSVDDPHQGLVCGRIPALGQQEEYLMCNFYEDDTLLSVGMSGTGLDLAGAAGLTKQLVEVATPA